MEGSEEVESEVLECVPVVVLQNMCPGESVPPTAVVYRPHVALPTKSFAAKIWEKEGRRETNNPETRTFSLYSEGSRNGSTSTPCGWRNRSSYFETPAPSLDTKSMNPASRR